MELRGLRLAPLALFVTAVALKRAGVLGLGEISPIVFGVALLVALALLWIGIDRYYARTFKLERSRGEIWQKALTVLLLGLLYAGFLVIELGGHSPIRVSLSGMFVGFLILGVGRRYGLWYFLILGALLVVEGLLPLPLGKSLADPVYGSLGTQYIFTLGIGLLFVSLLDHIHLRNNDNTSS